MKRVLGTILSVLVATGLSSACGSSPTSPDASATAAFVGLWAASSSSKGTLSVVWQLGGIEVNTQSLTISGGQLHSALHTHFIDGSGRPDYDAADVFNKVS